MDFGEYLKKGRGPKELYNRVKRCLYCGIELDNDGTYLYRQSFCSEQCKGKYIAED